MNRVYQRGLRVYPEMPYDERSIFGTLLADHSVGSVPLLVGFRRTFQADELTSTRFSLSRPPPPGWCESGLAWDSAFDDPLKATVSV